MTTSRAAPTIARQFTQTLDTAFFRALCEPARVELLAALIAKGPTDINALADAVPQDRSVVSRHLKVPGRRRHPPLRQGRTTPDIPDPGRLRRRLSGEAPGAGTRHGQAMLLTIFPNMCTYAH
ncbi:hypothetical protein PEC18_30230 [Paucibacter sp. O1-1]|nr:hypothetical protein [Paucibacter sp. O1-1]MDA3829997.1 hypothetical protein [Paucibacter sp. O1-1]